ncbi:hypothetical protein [Polaromonas sp.]|uniref:hypothetical protein n=1 Tax=Polaromonas sp. TaxID=1869339 RepID=UPI00356B5992
MKFMIVNNASPCSDGRVQPPNLKQDADGIGVFMDGVIPRQDYEMLYEAGVKGIYGPGTPIPASAKDVLEQIKAALGS